MTAEDVLHEFTAFSAIPRCSGNEKAAAEFIARQADSGGYAHRIDEAGNIAVSVPASKGMEKVPIVILQGHLDMVCVKDENNPHDFTKDPIMPNRDGDYITADGTTLGADNGMAVALMLAVMKDTSLSHGPLELLFTVEEEVGLIGATNLGPDMVQGDYLLNLDFEEDYQICIGCAGGAIFTIEGNLPVEPVSSEKYTGWRLSADGLKGGHSGIYIDSSPENLYHRMFRFLETITPLHPLVTEILGKGKSNALPTNCTITFYLSEKHERDLQRFYDIFEKEFFETYSDPETELSLSLKKTNSGTGKALTKEGLRILTDLFKALPVGVISRNKDLGNMVSTSANQGYLMFDSNGAICIKMSIRSDNQQFLDREMDRTRKVLKTADLEITDLADYPPWPPAPESRLVSLCQDCRKGLFENEAEVVTIHAGLECGIISSKQNGIDAVSIGPNLFDVHTTRERIQVSSLEKFVPWLQAILARQAELQ